MLIFRIFGIFWLNIELEAICQTYMHSCIFLGFLNLLSKIIFYVKRNFNDLHITFVGANCFVGANFHRSYQKSRNCETFFHESFFFKVMLSFFAWLTLSSHEDLSHMLKYKQYHVLWCLSEKEAATFYYEYNELYSTRYSADAFGYSELKLALAKWKISL